MGPLEYWVLSHSKEIATHTTVGLIAHPTTRKHGIKLGLWGMKNIAFPLASAGATVTANIARGAAPYLARASGVAVSGYALGTVFGVGLSSHFFGHEGREAAIDLYSSPIDGFWQKAILGLPANVDTILSSR
ncbi:MAG: hypothetical protein [Circular genetic element sp.]|nr:MAG: hypothetical protein [Circular genetic element sp.]